MNLKVYKMRKNIFFLKCLKIISMWHELLTWIEANHICDLIFEQQSLLSLLNIPYNIF